MMRQRLRELACGFLGHQLDSDAVALTLGHLQRGEYAWMRCHRCGAMLARARAT